jgi:iron complex outermembrane receptor protein
VRVAEWPRPLDRIVSVALGELTLGKALDEIAARTGVHLSYSPDLLPLSRTVCLSADSRPLGEILLALLGTSGVAPVVIGPDHVVLAPSRSAVGMEATPALARTTGVLERVVVTGTATGGPERASPLAIGTVDRRTLTLSSSPPPSLASIISGTVPGVWMWAQSPVDALARYGSIRGASSFGISTPKMYVDGIEVANPLLFTTLDPNQIERIEVIRGPQGAALYGADAISGVVNIVTRHDGADADTPSTDVRASAGTSTSSYAEEGVLSQEYGASVRAGSPARSASLGFSLSTLGAFTPGASAKQFLANGSLRHVGARLIITGTARFDAANADSPTSPILRAYLTSPAGPADSALQRVRQYTVGGTATLQASEQWMHALTLGVDGYRLSGVSGDPMPLPSTTDSALRAARGGADRLTLRYSSTRRTDDAARAGTQITFGLEHSTARERASGLGSHLAPRLDGPGPPGLPTDVNDDRTPVTSWWSNTGAFTQGELSLGNSVFVTGGARLEYMSGPSETGRFALLPMLGSSWVHDDGPMTLKLRAAYGRGIRPVRSVARGATFMGGRGPGTFTSLDPEEQSGVEAGMDAMWGRHLGLHVTRFDQRASGLVQPVAMLEPSSSGVPPPPGSPETAHVRYQLQNVGAIDNSGWELEGTSSLGALSLSATMTLVTSRVAQLATGYLGDLQKGDRMLEVPARTLGFQATWVVSRWSLNGTLSRASHWVNYDRVALVKTIAADPTGRLTPVGASLRAYWESYDGPTHLGASASYQVRERTSIVLIGANLLNRQTGEPDNVTVVPGRTINLGVRNTF